MTLREYVDVARDRWRFVLAGLLIGLLTATGLIFLLPPEYSSSVTVMLSAQVANDDAATATAGDQLSTQRVRTYLELLRSKRLAADVVNELGLPVTPEELVEKIAATTTPDTVLLTATVTDESADQAVTLANVVAAQFIRNVAELEQPADPARAPLVVAKVFQAAEPPADQIAPRPVLYGLLGLVLGLALGLGAALLRNALDTSIKKRHQLEEILEAPVLGVIGRDTKIQKSPLVIYGDPQAPLAEAFRQLRTNVQFMDVDREHKVLLVTSSLPAEGKSTTVCNVGLALAEAGTRVLIIDADLRRPTMAKCLRIDGSVGLTNVLVNRVSVVKAIQPVGPALDVMPSGLIPPNPSELLGSDQMANLIAGLRGSYDVILLDASPLLPVTDAAVLAPRADGVLFVVRYGRTHVKDVQAAKEALDAVSGRVLGSVLTMVPSSGRPRYPSYTARGEQLRQAGPAYPVRTSVGRRPSPVDDRTGDDRTVDMVAEADSDRRRPSPTPRRGIAANGNGQQLERERGRTPR